MLNSWSSKNQISPQDVSYSSKKEFWFDCPRGIHESRKISIQLIKLLKKSHCIACNSFAQWGIDHYGDGFLLNYWDKTNTLDPYKIPKSSTKKVRINCSNQSHGEYEISCNQFVVAFPNSGCTKCNVRGKKGTPVITDSLGYLYPTSIALFSDKNKNMTPYKLTPKSHKKIFWKCENKIHADYERVVSEQVRYDFRCPICSRLSNVSMLEQKVTEYIEAQYKLDVLHEYECSIAPICKSGYNNVRLPYDNEIPELNLIIEVHGAQHYKYSSWHGLVARRNNTTPEFELLQQQSRDKYKKEYAIKNGYYYLEIPYYAEKNDDYKKIIDQKINYIKSQNP